MERPPSRVEWAIEAEIRGHSVAESLAYLDWCDDYAAEQQQQRTRRRALPPTAISPDAEPFPRLRRWFGK